jgi:hypothetical protein
VLAAGRNDLQAIGTGEVNYRQKNPIYAGTLAMSQGYRALLALVILPKEALVTVVLMPTRFGALNATRPSHRSRG